ncbi:hypothetical protein ACFQ6V_02285 [Streptomyces roseifaciens]
MEIHGSCSDQFSAVQAVFADSLRNGADVGASVAVHLDGEPVVDLWGGHADQARTRPWQSRGIDLVLGIPLRFGIGYALNAAGTPVTMAGPHACYWGGRGGSLIVNDLGARMTFAYVMNQMTDLGLADPRGHALLRATYEALTLRGGALRVPGPRA